MLWSEGLIGRSVIVGLLTVTLGACGAAAPGDDVRSGPDQTLTELPSRPEPPPLNAAVISTRDEIRGLATAMRLRGLARLADRSDGFVSNFAGDSHYNHWLLLRSTGVDPLAQLLTLLDAPHATKQVGEEIWYIWPDLAALGPDALIPERLGFQDRARLQALVGEEGIARIRDGSAYPGFRTAIAEDGRWVYYLHEVGDERAQ